MRCWEKKKKKFKLMKEESDGNKSGKDFNKIAAFFNPLPVNPDQNYNYWKADLICPEFLQGLHGSYGGKKQTLVNKKS